MLCIIILRFLALLISSSAPKSRRGPPRLLTGFRDSEEAEPLGPHEPSKKAYGSYALVRMNLGDHMTRLGGRRKNCGSVRVDDPNFLGGSFAPQGRRKAPVHVADWVQRAVRGFSGLAAHSPRLFPKKGTSRGSSLLATRPWIWDLMRMGAEH